ncbi:hypothetical protein M422DRAFT_255827 [Sphaerobolus stellatus SS14]|uniref:Uncharacterized protein n=1 Tax=Sphaerobolus stellatus (strain SS14) TaxID=990650 RepID=A0A0C9V2V0_SPHS4|nr:hypothetical protein M422DRAFT_255827 [Sphaerobolus stellatus SS14]
MSSPDAASGSSTYSELENLLNVVDHEIVREYRDKYFPPDVVQACPNKYSIENAKEWIIKPEKFFQFVAYWYQRRTPPASPVAKPVRGPEIVEGETSSARCNQVLASTSQNLDISEGGVLRLKPIGAHLPPAANQQHVQLSLAPMVFNNPSPAIYESSSPAQSALNPLKRKRVSKGEARLSEGEHQYLYQENQQPTIWI